MILKKYFGQKAQLLLAEMAQFVLAEIVMFFNFFSYLNFYFKGNRKPFPLDFFFFLV